MTDKNSTTRLSDVLTLLLMEVLEFSLVQGKVICVAMGNSHT